METFSLTFPTFRIGTMYCHFPKEWNLPALTLYVPFCYPVIRGLTMAWFCGET